MQLAFYSGKGLISRAIRFQTWSRYSHVGILFPDGSIIEAWHKGGVLRNPSISSVHDSGTEVDIYDIDAPEDKKAMYACLLEGELGKAYDFRGVFRFLVRGNMHLDAQPEDWFCSELAYGKAKQAQIYFLRKDVPALKVSPDTLSMSPLLSYSCTKITK